MKYISIVLLTISLSVVGFGQSGMAESADGQEIQLRPEIKWYSLEEAIELNKTAPKKFMIDVYTDWCGWCKRMDAQTFSDEAIAAYVNENFYAVKFNAEMKDTIYLGNRSYKFVANGRRGYHEMAAVLTQGRLSYPTIVYLDEETRHIRVEPGFKMVAQLMERLVYYKEELYKQEEPVATY